MAKQNLMWTALPNGFDKDGALRVSALLSPRLTPDADQILKPFRDFLDWPETIRASKFTIIYGAQGVSIAGDQTAGDERVDGTVDLADSDAWRAMFSKSTFVSGYQFEDLSGNTVLSYDTVALDFLTRSLYASLGAAAGDSLPKISEILNDNNWSEVIQGVATIDRMFAAQTRDGLRDTRQQFSRYAEDGLKIGSAVATLLAQAQLFHTPPSTPEVQDYSGAALEPGDPRKKAKWRTYRRADLPKPEDFAKQIDFHQIVAAMNQYPRLLRKLGLVIDFVIPRDRFTASPNQALSIVCDLGTPAGAVARVSASPRTRTTLARGVFQALPRPNPQAGDCMVRNGLLVINQDLFGLLQNDVDAAGLKVMNFARTLRLMQEEPERRFDSVSRYENEAGAPALRNAGLMLVQRRRKRMIENAFAYNKANDQALQNAFQNSNNALAPDLFAEDITRGWRIDIWDDKTERWHSLCERKSAHQIAETIDVSDDREGIVRLAATKSADETSNAKLVYLHEALVSWTGWSLVAPQPGRAVDPNDGVGDTIAEVPPGMPLESTFAAVPGSLPRLRYGRRYWIRARMVDLAANSLPPSPKDHADERPKDNAMRYLRFAPVQPPSLALVRDGGNVEKPEEGESMERIAIRTFNATPPDNLISATQVARRFAVPAQTTVREAELHGMLDAGGKLNSSQATFDMLAEKDHALEEVKLVTPGPLSEPDSTVETSYAVMDAPATEIPYLPDPLCVTLSARIFDHPLFPSSQIIPIPLYASGSSWPDVAPFTIRIFESPGELPSFDASKRVLQIPLPKAVRATLRLSSQLTPASRDLMGVWDWLAPSARIVHNARSLAGQHWMLTPWRSFELVHAVQKPLIEPEMKFSLDRGFGDTKAFPRFVATCSLASTSRVDLQAVWNEPGPDSDAVGTNRARADHAFSVKITDAKSYAAKNVVPGATGIPEHEIAGTDLIAVGQSRGGIPKFHEFGDTRYRRIEYWLEATTRFREFMPPAILTKDEGGTTVETDENIKVTGPSVVTWVPNTSPPPAPEVLYVVPTFGWNSTKNALGTESRWRRGGGLRVYLDRPWNVSGYGEMLAVVLPRAAFAEDPNLLPVGKPYKKFVTQWGNDPIWTSAFVSGPAPKATNFPLRRTGPDPAGNWLPSFAPSIEAEQPPGPFRITDLPHPDLGPMTFGDTAGLVDLAPHDVAYDTERRLWYCDVEVNFGASYYPFIRLALARYQPVSVPTAHLSNIVLADFMALTPDRWLTVSAGANARTRNVSVFGFTYSNSGGNAEAKASASTVLAGNRIERPASVSASSVVEVWIEKLNPALGEDFGWQRIATVESEPEKAPAKPKKPTAKSAAAAEAELEAVMEQGTLGVINRALIVNPLLIWPTLWTGSIKLPEDPSATARYRLVVAEFEEYLIDDATPYNPTPSQKGQRLVFVEHVELT